jgi:hypothetical protein
MQLLSIDVSSNTEHSQVMKSQNWRYKRTNQALGSSV